MKKRPGLAHFKKLLTSRLESWSPVIGSSHSANCATTTALKNISNCYFDNLKADVAVNLGQNWKLTYVHVLSASAIFDSWVIFQTPNHRDQFTVLSRLKRKKLKTCWTVVVVHRELHTSQTTKSKVQTPILVSLTDDIGTVLACLLNRTWLAFNQIKKAFLNTPFTFHFSVYLLPFK